MDPKRSLFAHVTENMHILIISKQKRVQNVWPTFNVKYIYPLDSDFSRGHSYMTFKQLGHDELNLEEFYEELNGPLTKIQGNST